jgi:hypothetical protein
MRTIKNCGNHFQELHNPVKWVSNCDKCDDHSPLPFGLRQWFDGGCVPSNVLGCHSPSTGIPRPVMGRIQVSFQKLVERYRDATPAILQLLYSISVFHVEYTSRMSNSKRLALLFLSLSKSFPCILIDLTATCGLPVNALWNVSEI